MGSRGATIRLWVLGVAVVASVAMVVGGFVFASRTFGSDNAFGLALLLILPLVASVRLCWRWPAVQGRELGFLVVLFCVVAAGGFFVVRRWDHLGLDWRHAEDVKWGAFESRLRQDPAFRDVQIHRPERKSLYWASGGVASQADLERLKSMAAECGLDRKQFEGPYSPGVRMDVRGG